MSKPYTEMDLITFQRRFGTEKACRKRLFQMRWPDGFRCPRCDSRRRISSKKEVFINARNANIKRRLPLALSCIAPELLSSNGFLITNEFQPALAVCMALAESEEQQHTPSAGSCFQGHTFG